MVGKEGGRNEGGNKKERGKEGRREEERDGGKEKATTIPVILLTEKWPSSIINL